MCFKKNFLETTQQAVLLRNADLFADDLEADQLLVRIEQIRALVTHRQRQYNRSLLKFVNYRINCGGTRIGLSYLHQAWLSLLPASTRLVQLERNCIY